MLANEIMGREVIGSSGFKLGKISDIEFDEKTWKVNSLQVHLEKEVAEEHELRHRFRKTKVMIHVDHVQALGERIILKGSREDLLKLIASATSAPGVTSENQKGEELGHISTEAAVAETQMPKTD
jgi:sporulation protein YlmC with PRC-barrel domain